MSHMLDSVIESSFECPDSVVAKLRRLKIQESLFMKNINKLSSKENENEVDQPILYSLHFKQFSIKIKDTFNEINMKFDDIKTEAEENINLGK